MALTKKVRKTDPRGWGGEAMFWAGTKTSVSDAHGSGCGSEGERREKGSCQPCKGHLEMSANGVCDKPCYRIMSWSKEPTHALWN